jgi:hypothetical protein
MDYNREKSNMSFNTAAITGASLPGTLTQFGALRTAIQGIILGTVVEETLYVNRTRLDNVPASDPNAQRERKWLVIYEDNTQFFDVAEAIPNAGYKKLFNVEIGTANFGGGRLLANSDDADLTETSIAAFITAFEALAKSPYGGAANVVRIVGVGRNT